MSTEKSPLLVNSSGGGTGEDGPVSGSSEENGDGFSGDGGGAALGDVLGDSGGKRASAGPQVYFSKQEQERGYATGFTSSAFGNTPLRTLDPRFFFSERQRGSTVWGSTVAVLCTAVGTGILGLPGALAQTGWLGLAVVVLVAVMANYTAKRLVRCMYVRKPRLKLRTYRAVGEAAFGNFGANLATGAQYSTLLGASILYMILAGGNVKSILVDQWKILAGWDTTTCTLISSALVTLPVVLLKTMREIQWATMMGFVASLMVVGVIIVCSAMYPIPEAEHKAIVPSQSLAFAFATFTFAFGGHSTFPTIQDEMRTKREFKRVFDWSFALMCLIYLPVCAVGYWAYGAQTKSPILENLLASGSKATELATVIATVAITLHLWFVIPLLLNPVALSTERAVNEWLAKRRGILPSTEDEPEDDYGFGLDAGTQFGVRAANRVLMCAFTTTIAIVLPSFGNFMAFIGATSVACTVFVLPCLFYMKLFYRRISSLEIAWICFVLLVACFASAVGVYSAVLGFAKSFGYKQAPPNWLLYVVLGVALVAAVLGVASCTRFIKKSHAGGR